MSYENSGLISNLSQTSPFWVYFTLIAGLGLTFLTELDYAINGLRHSATNTLFDIENTYFDDLYYYLILPLVAVFSIYQTFPSQCNPNACLDPMRPFVSIAFATTFLWNLVEICEGPGIAYTEPLYWIEEIFFFLLGIIGILTPLYMLLFKVFHQCGQCAKISTFSLEKLPVSLFAGWMTYEILDDFLDLLNNAGVPNLAVGGPQYPMIIFFSLVSLILIALITLSKYNIPFASVFIWIYVFLAYTNATDGYNIVELLSIIFTIMFLLVSVVGLIYEARNGYQTLPFYA